MSTWLPILRSIGAPVRRWVRRARWPFGRWICADASAFLVPNLARPLQPLSPGSASSPIPGKIGGMGISRQLSRIRPASFPKRQGHSTISRFFCPNLVGAPPQQVSAARLLAGYDPAKPARRNVLGPELRCSLQDGTAAVSGRGHSAAPGFAAWVAEKGVHHESRVCPSQ
jgi:hypothetical protein